MQLVDAQQKYTRAKELAAKSLLPQSDLDAAKIAVDSAQASCTRSRQRSARRRRRSRSRRRRSTRTRSTSTTPIITAPIDGIVTQRSVDVGQTVAASMQAPTLFIIAADLTKMQVNANIDEADVGRIRPGQHVTFRVDAYPTETFNGTVSQIRLQPVVVQNVTTYGTVIDVPNPQLKLKPGMTANVKVEIAKRTTCCACRTRRCASGRPTDMFAALNQAVPPEAHAAAAVTRRRAGAAEDAGDADAGGAGAAGAPAGTAGPPASASRQIASRGPGAEAPAAPGRTRSRAEVAGAAIRSRPHDGALQEHVAGRAAAVHRANEGPRPDTSAFESAAAKPAASGARRNLAQAAQTA